MKTKKLCRYTERPIVRRVLVDITDVVDDALDDIMAARSCPCQKRQTLCELLLAEAVLTVADSIRERGGFMWFPRLELSDSLKGARDGEWAERYRLADSVMSVDTPG